MDNTPNKNKRLILIILGIAVAVGLIAGLIIWLLPKKEKTREEGSETPGTVSETDAVTEGSTEAASGSQEGWKPQDADTFYHENATVLDVSEAASYALLSEREAVEDLRNRGFSDAPVFTEYSAAGEYSPEEEVPEDGEGRHPEYDLYYAAGEEVWTVSVVGDQITAYPVGYNLEGGKGYEVIVAEKDSMLGYDSRDNRFYSIIPKEESCRILRVERIDAKILEGLTKEVIDAYFH